MRNYSILPEDIKLTDQSLAGIAGGVIQGEVLALLIKGRGRGNWSNVPLKKFKEIKANESMGVPIDDHFIKECLSDLAKRGLARFNEKEARLTNHGIQIVHDICTAPA